MKEKEFKKIENIAEYVKDGVKNGKKYYRKKEYRIEEDNMEEKSLIVENKGFFSKFFRKIKTFFNKKSKIDYEEIKSNDSVKINSVDKMIEVKSSYENGKTDLTTLTQEELKDLEMLYDVQIDSLKKKITEVKEDILKIDNELLNYQ